MYGTLTTALNCSPQPLSPAILTTAIPRSVYPTPDSSILLDLDAPACKRLTSRAFSPHEVIPLIEAIFTNQDEVKMIGYLRGDDAQTFIDVIHEVCLRYPSFPRPGLISLVPFDSFTFESLPSAVQALDLPDLPPRLRRKCLSALCRICGRQASLPRSLQIPLCYDRLDNPLYRGGYADVWKGQHQGFNVAVKVLRVYSTSDFEKITSVSSHRPVKNLCWSANTGPFRDSAKRL